MNAILLINAFSARMLQACVKGRPVGWSV